MSRPYVKPWSAYELEIVVDRQRKGDHLAAIAVRINREPQEIDEALWALLGGVPRAVADLLNTRNGHGPEAWRDSHRRLSGGVLWLERARA